MTATARADHLPDDPMIYFLAHNVSISELARLYAGRKGLYRMALSRRARAEDWWGRRSRLRAKVAQKTDDKIADAEAERNARHMRGVKNVETVADSFVQGVAAEIMRSGGIAAVLQDSKKARSLALVLRASELALLGAIHVERNMIGKGAEPLQKIFEAAERAAAEIDGESAPSGNGGNGSRTSRAMPLRGGDRRPEEAVT